MALTLCCQYLESKKKKDNSIVYENIIEEKSLQLGAFKEGKYSDKRIAETYHNNIDTHINIIPSLIKNNIKSFRLSSSIFPLYDFNRERIWSDSKLIEKIKYLGDLFIKNNIRVSTHPGQFCIINSDAEHVIKNSIAELEYHAWIFDTMGFDKSHFYAINIHGGKRGNIKKLIDSIGILSDSVRKRLTLENDERCFSVNNLLEVSKATNTPIVFDSHHHQFNMDNLSTEDAAVECMKTWKDIKPIQHLSNTEPGNENGSFTEKRKHSQFIHYIPNIQKDLLLNDSIDLDVEAKMKNIAIFKMRNDFNIIN
jgi:UV DNA damage endonuclease